MKRQDIRIAIARHQQFIDRAVAMIEADAAGHDLSEEQQFYQLELEALDSTTAMLVHDALGRAPAAEEWQAPGTYAFANQPQGSQWSSMGWIKTYRRALQMSKGYLEALLEATPE